jgi:hypothetical protein
LDPELITGRVFIIILKNNQREPKFQEGSYGGSVPFFGLDVNHMKPGDTTVIDGRPHTTVFPAPFEGEEGRTIHLMETTS